MAGHGNITMGLGLPPEVAVRGVYWSLQGVMCPRQGSVVVLPLAADVTVISPVFIIVVVVILFHCLYFTYITASITVGRNPEVRQILPSLLLKVKWSSVINACTQTHTHM